ncbi:MAG: methionyl-tRNA formyltransferase [Hyphomicrobiales bacterium]|nr:methionyl-tRNA formyltransferase [Hyphomicrobiales bacterium]
MPLRLVFMGTPDFAVPALLEIAGAGHDIAAVYTRAPKPSGRGLQLQQTPVATQARRLGLPVLTPKSLRSEAAQADFRAHGADVAVVVAYGLILPQAILDAPRLGCFNLHASLLPRWRGAAPINRAVMAGDRESGVTVMQMDAGLDTGGMAMMERVAVAPDMTAGELHDTLARIGGDLMLRALGALERGSLTIVPQPQEGVTYADKIEKAETRIDWRQPASDVHNRIRGLSPFPGAWFELPGTTPQRVKVLRSTLVQGAGAPGQLLDDSLTVACGAAAVRLLQLQRAGKQPMPAQDFLRGTPLPRGITLG